LGGGGWYASYVQHSSFVWPADSLVSLSYLLPKSEGCSCLVLAVLNIGFCFTADQEYEYASYTVCFQVSVLLFAIGMITITLIILVLDATNLVRSHE